MKTIFYLPMVLIRFLALGQNTGSEKANPLSYLSDLKKVDLQEKNGHLIARLMNLLWVKLFKSA